MDIDQREGSKTGSLDYLKPTEGKAQINPQGVANSMNWVYINGLGERD